MFKHDGETSIAIAQNEDERVLIVSLDGEVKQQLDMPKGGEFNFAEANAYYSEKPIKQVRSLVLTGQCMACLSS